MSLLKVALKYLNELHYSILPVGPDKRPCWDDKTKKHFQWDPYKKRLPTESEVKAWFDKWPDANIGIVTGLISGVAVVDIDDPDVAKPFLSEYIPDTLEFPISKTPSGGEHWFFQLTDDIGTKKIPGGDFKGNPAYVVAPPSHCIYDKGPKHIEGTYRWDEKLKPSKTPLPYLPIAFKEYLKSINKNIVCEDKKDCLQKSTASTNVYKMFQFGGRDDDLFHVANHLIKSRMPLTEVYQVVERLALSCDPPFDLREVPAKIESAIRRSSAHSTTLAQDVEDWVLSTNGNFLSTDIYKCLLLSTRDEHKNVSIILKRLLDKGVIEKYGNKNGSWRMIDNESQNINWYDAQVETVHIKWPFEIEDQALTMPRNIIVVAGVPNAGKTAFLLNVVALNMRQHKINYFSSEMGAMELRGRISKFDMPLKDWRFTAKERAGNFEDVIIPDEVNIIDFMEIHDEFYKIGGMIKKIYDKLTTGLAIIALQKNPGSTMARGGIGSLEKPRLYLTLDSNILTIEKAKNWTYEDRNPNGWRIKFKLHKGASFIQQGTWYPKEVDAKK